MSKAQRDKGKRGELEVRDVFRTHGFDDVDRTPNSGGLKIVGDLYGQSIEDARLHVEVKRAESLALPAWTRQAEADCPEGFTPIVAYRRSNEPWRGSLDLNRLVRLLAIERVFEWERAGGRWPCPDCGGPHTVADVRANDPSAGHSVGCVRRSR